LLLKRFDDEAEQDILLPSSREPLQAGDELLFCGRYGTQARIEGLVANLNLLEYVLFGEDRPAGTIWRRLPRRESAS
jgi:hypothetical protein